MDFGEEQRLLSSIGDDPHSQAVTGMFGGTKFSPEQLAALFLVTGLNWRAGKEPEMTVAGQSGQYNIMHDKNGKVGFADLTWGPKSKDVQIDMIGIPPEKMKNSVASGLAVKGNEWAHGAGTSEMKSLIKSLMKTFPEAETVSGLRISGAKELAQDAGRMSTKDQQVTMKLPRSFGGSAPPFTKPGGNLLPGDIGAPGMRVTDLW